MVTLKVKTQISFFFFFWHVCSVGDSPSKDQEPGGQKWNGNVGTLVLTFWAAISETKDPVNAALLSSADKASVECTGVDIFFPYAGL